MRRRTARTCVSAPFTAGAALLLAVLPVAGVPAGATATAHSRPPALVADPAALVDPLDGTGTGTTSPGAVGEFPGADTPFGMVQWSPDTSPNAAQSGGGYSVADTAVTGFSLTHLSGSGCAAGGDVPVLPTTGPVGPDPGQSASPFTHAGERAAPGRYAVTVGTPPISTSLAVTERTGIASFTFPPSAAANLLLKVGGSANPPSAAAVELTGDREVSGQVTSGQFCGTGPDYTLHFVARFDRPFAASGTWDAAGVAAGSTHCTGPTCGAYVTFDARTQRSVVAKVGVSYVSTADAAANLAGEDTGWSVPAVAARASSAWNALLDRVRVGGGTRAEQRTFYTALYHSLLFPSVVSDEQGRYPGADGRVHTASGRQEYTNFSEWDVYRSEFQLVSLLAPRRTGDMVQSLVDSASQDGWLPKWAVVGGDAAQMNGDSADLLIAEALAFGVHNFDVGAALTAMVHGADRSESGHGLQIERQYLDQYLSQHYVNAASPDLTSIDYTIGGSATLEYALDDFAIAQVANARGEHALADRMLSRAHNWEYLFDPATDAVGARGADGSFPPGPAFDPAQLEPGGQQGFEEGNAVQYTWSIPQDLGALGALLGGGAAATSELDAFFTQLNAGRFQPYDWAGNEPGLWAPYEYDAFGSPARTQAVVREIETRLYADAPVDEPGNDDLGALASWYVWSALGVFPLVPGTSDLALSSPLFPRAVVSLPDGKQLAIDAPAASPANPYVHALHVDAPGIAMAAPTCGPASGTGHTSGWAQPWLPGSILRTGGTLQFALSAAPDPSWGSDPGRAVHSQATGRLPAIGYSQPTGALGATVVQPAPLMLGIRTAGGAAVAVRWSASGTGLMVSPASGTLETTAAPAGSCAPSGGAQAGLVVTAATPGVHPLVVELRTAGGTALPPVVVDVQVAG